MKVIYKYEIDLSVPDVTLSLPFGAEVVKVGTQRPGAVTFWIEQEQNCPSELYENRRFFIYGTGHPIRATAKYVGTTLDEPYVWHLYEVK